jgi:hypothetical protein
MLCISINIASAVLWVSFACWLAMNNASGRVASSSRPKLTVALHRLATPALFSRDSTMMIEYTLILFGGFSAAGACPGAFDQRRLIR